MLRGTGQTPLSSRECERAAYGLLGGGGGGWSAVQFRASAPHGVGRGVQRGRGILWIPCFILSVLSLRSTGADSPIPLHHKRGGGYLEWPYTIRGWAVNPCPPLHPVNGTGNSPSLGRPTPGGVQQDKSSRGSVDTTQARSDPRRVGLCSGERPIAPPKANNQHHGLVPTPPPLHQSDHRGRIQTLPSGKSDRAISGAQMFGSPPPPPGLL